MSTNISTTGRRAVLAAPIAKGPGAASRVPRCGHAARGGSDGQRVCVHTTFAGEQITRYSPEAGAPLKHTAPLVVPPATNDPELRDLSMAAPMPADTVAPVGPSSCQSKR